MRAYEFIYHLFEYNRDKTIKTFKDKLINKIKNDGTHLRYVKMGFINDDSIINDIISILEEADPTEKKSYLPWIMREYLKNNISLEDCNKNVVGKVYDTLEAHLYYKEKKDFPNQIKDITSNDYQTLKSAVEKFIEFFKSKTTKVISKGNFKLIHEDQSVKVIEPLDVDSACYYGLGSNWCTAYTVAPNRFNQYITDGPLYIIIPKKPKYTGEKYQLQFEESRFSDDKNKIIDIMEFFETYPILYEIFSKYNIQKKYYITKNQKYSDILWNRISLIEKEVIKELDINPKLFQFRDFNKRVYAINNKFQETTLKAATLLNLFDFIRIYHHYHFNEDVSNMLKYADEYINNKLFKVLDRIFTYQHDPYQFHYHVPTVGTKLNNQEIGLFYPSLEDQQKMVNYIKSEEEKYKNEVITYVNNAYKKIEEKVDLITKRILNQK